MEEDWEVPKSFLARELTAKDRENLITEIGFPKKWTSFKKWLEQSERYTISKRRTKKEDLWTIIEK